MKILFVERDVEYIDPMNIELLSALARRQGASTFLTILAVDDLEADLRRIRPDVVAFSAKTGEHTAYCRANRQVKAHSASIRTIMGGPHPTFFPGLILREPVDALALGAADEAWGDLLDAVAAGRSPHWIPNIVTPDNAHRVLRGRKTAPPAVARTGAPVAQHPMTELTVQPDHLRPKRQTLDDLPFGDRELIYRHTHLRDFPMRSVMASRGCPFTCTYCFQPQFNVLYAGKGPIYTRFSVPRLCAELKELKERWPTRFIKFYDDMFILHRGAEPWLEEFAEVYPREVGLPFFCLTRCNVLTPENLALLKRAGLHSLTMSIEAGNAYVRNEIVQRHMTEEQIRAAYALCEREGIVTFANTLLGIPLRADVMARQGKTALDYDLESLDLNIACHVTYAEFPVLHPYPGCELTAYAVHNGFFDGDFDRLFYSYQAESPFRCFSPQEVRQQKNLSLLGPVCVLFPRARWLRTLTVRWLIRWPLTPLYFWPWYLTKAYLNIFRLYPVRLSVWGLLRNLPYSLRREWRKRAPARAVYQRQDRARVPTLGGPPPRLQMAPPQVARSAWFR